jgi:hypothetical protein
VPLGSDVLRSVGGWNRSFMGEARNIYNAACAQIASALAQDGFKYRPTKHSLVRRDDDLTHEITFQSSFRNFTVPNHVGLQRLPLIGDTAGSGSVTLIAHALVHSKSFRQWRAAQKQSLGTDDLITVGQIGNLQAKPEWLEFNLANPHERDRVVRDVTELIRKVALPYLGCFSNPQGVIVGLIAGKMPWSWWEPSALEYAVCFGTPAQARELLLRYIQRRPGLEGEFRERVKEYRKQGVPEVFDSTASGRLAKAALALGLESPE